MNTFRHFMHILQNAVFACLQSNTCNTNTVTTVTDKLSFTYPYNFRYSVFLLHRTRIHMIFFCTAPHSNFGITACQRCENVSFSQCPIFCLWWQYHKISYNYRMEWAVVMILVPTCSALTRVCIQSYEVWCNV